MTAPPDFWQMGILVLEGLLRWERLNGNSTLKQYSNWEVTGLVNVIVLQCWTFCLNSFFSLSEKEPSFLLQRTSGRRHRCWRYCRSEGRFSAYSIWFDIKPPQLLAWPWQGVQISNVGHGITYGDVTYSQFKLCVSAQESPNVPWSMTELTKWECV